jgi:hypothetical protein
MENENPHQVISIATLANHSLIFSSMLALFNGNIIQVNHTNMPNFDILNQASRRLAICPPLCSSAPRSTTAFIVSAAATGGRHQFYHYFTKGTNIFCNILLKLKTSIAWCSLEVKETAYMNDTSSHMRQKWKAEIIY